jgi:hypothetical protein
MAAWANWGDATAYEHTQSPPAIRSPAKIPSAPWAAMISACRNSGRVVQRRVNATFINWPHISFSTMMASRTLVGGTYLQDGESSKRKPSPSQVMSIGANIRSR